MTTKEAFTYVLDEDEHANKYRLSKTFGCSHTSIANYCSGKRPISFEIYQKFRDVYPTIEITDVQKPQVYTLGNI